MNCAWAQNACRDGFSVLHKKTSELFRELALPCTSSATLKFAKTSLSFVAQLRQKRPHYLAFLSYPETIRRSLCTTNTVEAINGQLEIMRRNSGGYFYSSGGYFYSKDTLKLKLD